MGQNISFRVDTIDHIELILDHTPQKYPFTGWTIQSHVDPCSVSILHVFYNN